MGLFERIKRWFTGAPAVSEASVAPGGSFATPAVQPAGAPNDAPARKPVIAVSGSSTSSKSVAAIMTQLRSSGAEPVFIGDHEERIKDGVQQAVSRDLSHIDGLVVMGNDNDIDPRKYGQTVDPKTHVEAPARAAYEEAAIQMALSKKVPLLGICGGMQRINVLGGGTLHQDVEALVGDDHHMQSKHDIAPFLPVQLVQIAEGSKLGEIAGGGSKVYTPRHSPLPPGVIMENSFHHQAVDKPRDDFRVCARSDDGIIEAIEPKPDSAYANQFVMGVQWHPEFGASDFGPKLAERMTQEAAHYAQGQNKVQEAEPTLMGEKLAPGDLAARVLAGRQNAGMGRFGPA